MRFFQRLYRYLGDRWDRVLSVLRILHFRLRYPTLKLGFNCYVGPGVEIISCDRSICDISNCHLSRGVHIKVDEGAVLKMVNSSVGPYSVIVAHESITIESDCSIGEMVVIRDQNHRYGNGIRIQDSGYETAPVRLRRNVWLGSKSTVLKGVELGENTVVGAHSLVNSSFGDNAVIAGIPARLISKS